MTTSRDVAEWTSRVTGALVPAQAAWGRDISSQSDAETHIEIDVDLLEDEDTPVTEVGERGAE